MPKNKKKTSNVVQLVDPNMLEPKSKLSAIPQRGDELDPKEEQDEKNAVQEEWDLLKRSVKDHTYMEGTDQEVAGNAFAKIIENIVRAICVAEAAVFHPKDAFKFVRVNVIDNFLNDAQGVLKKADDCLKFLGFPMYDLTQARGTLHMLMDKMEHLKSTKKSNKGENKTAESTGKFTPSYQGSSAQATSERTLPLVVDSPQAGSEPGRSRPKK